MNTCPVAGSFCADVLSLPACRRTTNASRCFLTAHECLRQLERIEPRGKPKQPRDQNKVIFWKRKFPEKFSRKFLFGNFLENYSLPCALGRPFLLAFCAQSRAADLYQISSPVPWRDPFARNSRRLKHLARSIIKIDVRAKGRLSTLLGTQDAGALHISAHQRWRFV